MTRQQVNFLRPGMVVRRHRWWPLAVLTALGVLTAWYGQVTHLQELEQQLALLEISRQQANPQAQPPPPLASQGVGALFAGLARSMVEGVWLTRMVIAEGGRRIILEGRTLSSESGLAWLDGLQQHSPFDHHWRFGQWSMTPQGEQQELFAFQVMGERLP